MNFQAQCPNCKEEIRFDIIGNNQVIGFCQYCKMNWKGSDKFKTE